MLGDDHSFMGGSDAMKSSVVRGDCVDIVTSYLVSRLDLVMNIVRYFYTLYISYILG